MKKLTLISTSFAMGLFASNVVPVAMATSGPLTILADTTLTEGHFGNITIGADGVTLDCAGYSVQGGGFGAGIGIHLYGRSRVTVTRCVVTGFDDGIFVENSYDNMLVDNTVSGNVGSGIKLNSSQHNVVTRNRVTDNDSGELFQGATALIIGQGSSRNIVTFNTVTGNESTGIVVADDDTNWNRIIGNVSAGNGAKGFDIIGVTRNTFKGNFVVDNAEYGFHVRGGSEFNFMIMNFACRNEPLDVLDEHETEGRSGNFWFRNLICTSQGI